MLILILFLTLPLVCAITHLGCTRHFEKACQTSIIFTIIFLFLSAYQLLWHRSLDNSLTFTLLDLDGTKLSLRFIADELSLIMLLLIGLVSLMVNLYASRYLYSDINRSRFMMQLALVTFAVVFLVMGGNLLTAFIGWQLIGFNLYWLLNHYHYDEYANRAAKKKFVINRAGDMTFLLAVILCLYFYSTTDYSVILAAHSPLLKIFNIEITTRTIILGFVFIAVMTKSAQFPFHIWLPDTMQTPTPVSAIMHAGVINAGGFLLARLAPGLLLTPSLLSFISCIGFISVVMGSLFAVTQPDVKKQLAYSTMSQMGYMVLQCGLGCFSGAIFHLFAHGLYKGWSFLNSGNQIFALQEKNKSSLSFMTTKIIISVGITTLMLFMFLLKEHHFITMISVYPLLMFFMVITVLQLNIFIWTNHGKISSKLISTFLIIIMVMLYVKVIVLNDFNTLSTFSLRKLLPSNLTLQTAGIISLILLLAICYFLQAKSKLFRTLYYIIINKLFIEEIYRGYLLEPTRKLGDKLYGLFSSRHSLFICLTAIALLAVMLAHGLNLTLNRYLAVFCCLLLIMLLLAANRARKLKHIVIYLVLSQFALSAIALQLVTLSSEKIASYQITNTTVLAFLMFYCLYKVNQGSAQKHFLKNNLPWLGAYFTASLFCLIGLPFTSTFISEVIIAREAINTMPLIIVGLLIAMLLLTISVLHVLQDYVFKENAIKSFSIKLSGFEHFIFLGLIVFNVINGLFPSVAVQTIYVGVHAL